MERIPFIFSDEKSYRVQRHLSFWIAWWLFQAMLYSFMAINQGIFYWLRLGSSAIESLLFLSAHIFLSYSLMYFVIPKYLLKGRYWETVLSTLLLFLVTAAISALLSVTLVEFVRVTILGPYYYAAQHHVADKIFLSLMAGLRGAITIGGLAAAIKLMKYWYLREQNNRQLQRENAAAQLKLLKAQIHPHFLFNTLNNIYFYTHNTSRQASRLVVGLSDMLRYILYEGNQGPVPLARELDMIRDYIGLEKIRYGNQLELSLAFPPRADHYSIAPLILLPFVENCFKHGTSSMLQKPWIRMVVNLEGNRMKMTLVNAKPPQAAKRESQSPGIGLQNARKRLQLLYPGNHELRITGDEELFIINLWIDLDPIPGKIPQEKTMLETYA